VRRQRSDSLFRWWFCLLLGFAILSSCVCSSSGAFLQQPLVGAYKLWRAEQTRYTHGVNKGSDRGDGERAINVCRHQPAPPPASFCYHGLSMRAFCLLHSRSQITADYYHSHSAVLETIFDFCKSKTRTIKNFDIPKRPINLYFFSILRRNLSKFVTQTGLY